MNFIDAKTRVKFLKILQIVTKPLNLKHHTYLDDIPKNIFSLVLKRFNQNIIKL